MKKTIILTSILTTMIATTAFAGADSSTPSASKTLNQGVYIGAGAGYANLNYDKGWLENTEDFDRVDSVDSEGLAGRFFLGYQLNDNFAFEMGYVALPKVKFNNLGASGFPQEVNESFRQSIFDVMLKLITPLKAGFDIYIKGGYANVFRDDLKMTINGEDVHANLDDRQDVYVFGGGAGYHITRNVIADISYLHYLGKGDLEPTDFGGVGIIYLFG